MQVLHTSSFLQICYYEEQAALETRWLGGAQGVELREALLEAVHLAHTRRVRHWIANQKKMHTLRGSDQQWIKEYYLPRLQLLNLESLSLVVSDDILNQLGMYHVLRDLPLVITGSVHYFNDLSSALRWMETQKLAFCPTENRCKSDG